MKKIITWQRAMVLVGIFAVFSLAYLACGGGGGSTPASSQGSTRGVVTGFGSIFVDNIEFSTVGARRRHLDDNTSDVPGLDNEVFRKGMVVTVRHGADDNGALEIEFVNDLEGPIQPGSVNVPAGTFSVLGVTVAVDNTPATGTQFDGLANIAALADNNVVEVSGLPDNTGVLRATYIRLVSASPAAGAVFEVKGFINTLVAGSSFNLGLVKGMTTGVPVTYSASVVTDMPAGGIANGIYVEVKTSSLAAPLAATVVEGKGDSEDDARIDAQMSVEGFIAGLTGTTPNFTFVIHGLTVTTSASTTGLGLVVPNAHVEAEGTTLNGVLQARTIKARP